MRDETPLLSPIPRQVAHSEGRLALDGEIALVLGAGTERSDRLRAAASRVLSSLGLDLLLAESSRAPLKLQLGISGRTPDSYRMCITPAGIEITGGDEAGVFYGLQTFWQWALQHPTRDLACLTIDDWPDFPRRGVMLDISRGRVPTVPHLLSVIDKLASWKINQVQLYTEHTFAYTGHETVWRGWSPLTPSEVRELDDYCHARFIDLVPNQNSFGHMHRWLVHDTYRPLAECPEGIDHPFSPDREPISLCPLDPGSLRLVEDLFEQLLPNFRSDLFNVGLDETFDLGLGRSREECERRGREEVYLDYLLKVHESVVGHGRQMLFWGDIIIERTDLVSRLPTDTTPLLWGYSPDHPFERECRLLAESPLDFWVCPGTSSWNSFGGRVDNALANLWQAARAGRDHGASGYLITDWGDNGHLQPPTISAPALLAGAMFAWSSDSGHDATELRLAQRLDLFALGGMKAGDVLLEIGNLYQAAGKVLPNSSALFNLLVFAHEPLEQRGLQDLRSADLGAAADRAEALRDRVASLPSVEDDHLRVRYELEWACDALRLGAQMGIERLETDSLAALPTASREALRARLVTLIEGHRDLWSFSSRPGGLDYSVGYLQRVADALS